MKLFKKKPVPEIPWYTKYFSSYTFSTEERRFLSYHTEQSLNKILGDEYFINSRYKISLDEYLKGVYHFINTGEKKYFYTRGQDKRDLRKENEALKILVGELLKSKSD